MFVFFRSIIYASLFIGLVLIYLPAQVVGDISGPLVRDWLYPTGIVIGSIGGLIALWCIFTFTFAGKGTPAPFDPPVKLVVRGPYRYVRNPMYVGAGMALAGASMVLHSWPLLVYLGGFFFCTHLFVVFYEEPTLRTTFGKEYELYCTRVNRWLPGKG